MKQVFGYGGTRIDSESPLSVVIKDRCSALVAMESKHGQPIIKFVYGCPRTKEKVLNLIADSRENWSKPTVAFSVNDSIPGNILEYSDDTIIASGKDANGNDIQVATDKKLLQELYKRGFADGNHICWYKVKK